MQTHGISGRFPRRYAQIKALAATAGARFITCEFVKVNGEERTMTIQPRALAKHVKGEAASESAQRGAATRAANHPNLWNVWDVHKRAPRSVNMDTLSAIVIDGTRYELHQN